MKKSIVTLALCAACAAPALWADEVGLLRSSIVRDSYPHIVRNEKYLRADVFDSACDKHWDLIAPLGGDTGDIDTNNIEPLLLSYMCPEVRDVRPPELVRMLPKSADSDKKVAALLYQNLQLATFLKSSNASAYAALFNEFCTDNKVSKAEVKTYFDRNIGALVSAEVDAQFNRVDFVIRDSAVNKSYNAVLARNAQNQYVLTYERPSVENDDKTLTAPTLEALLAEMRKNTADFSQASIDTVRAQAALMSAVMFDGWQKTTPNMVSPTGLFTEALTNFYITPNKTNYEIVRGIYARILIAQRADKEDFSDNLGDAVFASLGSLSRDLSAKISNDLNVSTDEILAASKIPNDPRYGIFSLTKATGDAIFVKKAAPATGLLVR